MADIAPPPAPPAKPAPAPAAPPAPPPAPPPTPAAPPAPSGGAGEDDMFAKLDSRISASRKKADAASAAPAPPPGPGLGDTSPKPDAGAAPPPAPTGPKALREQYEATSTELKTTKARITEMERKLADAEARGRDTTALTQRLADMEKEKATLQGELRAFRAEKDPEFQAKWEKP